MKVLLKHFLFTSLVFFTASQCATATERTSITVLSTTDLHAHIAPVDYFTNKPANYGLAKVGTLIRQAQKVDPQLLLLDVGDTIQGSPMGYFHARKDPAPRDPTMLVMSTLGYTSMTVGNHEFNFGRTVLEKARSEASFPWLSANIVKKADQTPLFMPYVIKEVKGVRVAILGLTTAGIPYWEDAKNISDLDFLDPLACAAHYVPLLREKEGAQVVIVAMHTGLEEDLASGRRPPGQVALENVALQVAEGVSGIDLILLGHTHRSLPALVINNCLIAQAGYWGSHLVKAELFLERPDASAPWKVFARSSQATPADASVPADPEIMSLIADCETETQAWLDGKIGNCAKELTATRSRLEDSALIDLIHKVQLEAGKADVSFAASFNLKARIPAGKVTVRDVYSLYTYENTLTVVEITGADIKAALEHAALYYLPYESGKSIEELTNPRIPGYNFDTAEGVDYEIDLKRAPGDRVINLRRKGEPLDPVAKLRVAVNNYRQNGGGGYTMFRNAPILERSSAEVRDLLLEWIEKHGEVPATATNNWRFVELKP